MPRAIYDFIQYVRVEAIVAKLTKTNNTKAPFIGEGMTLGEVVLAHVCWFSEINTSLAIRDKKYLPRSMGW